MTQRVFGSVALAALLCNPALLYATRAPSNIPMQPETYRLRLYDTHTRERIDVVYRAGDNYISSAIAALDDFLRDHRTGTVTQINPNLFDLLHDLTVAVGRPDTEIDIICGYRTQWSNAFLRRTSPGVAEHSLHMEGEAIDIRILGVTTTQLRDAAELLHRGGVGYYPVSKFVHVDLGRVRRWQYPQ